MPTMLTSRISVPIPANPEVEDIFCSALGAIFTDDTVNSHGTPGSMIFYRSPRFGDMTLHIPAHPDVEDGRQLFAHYLWNAAVIAAEGIEQASTSGVGQGEPEREEDDATKVLPDSTVQEAKSETDVLWDPRYWDMRGKRVLELGAGPSNGKRRGRIFDSLQSGTALPSLISALSGAKSCTITDHPSSPALTTDAIRRNVRGNLFHKPRSEIVAPEPPQPPPSPPSANRSPPTTASTRTNTSIAVYGYTWGTSTFYDAEKYGRPVATVSRSKSQPRPQKQQQLPRQHSTDPLTFDRIIIADCLWIRAQHLNLVRTILRYLDPDQSNNSCALVVAGFHTGRSIVRDFFAAATTTMVDDDGEIVDEENHSRGGGLRIAEIFEIDVEGKRRAWEPELLGETKDQAKKWCVCAILVRR